MDKENDGILSPFQMGGGKGKLNQEFLKRLQKDMNGEEEVLIDSFPVSKEIQEIHEDLVKRMDFLLTEAKQMENKRKYMWNLIDQESYKRGKVGSRSHYNSKTLTIEVYDNKKTR